MAKLSQIIAVEKGVKSDKDDIFTKAYQAFAQDPRFTGISRTYTPFDEEDTSYPPESTLVQVTVPDLVESVEAALTRMFDVVTTKDNGNTEARADIKVDGDGEVLASSVPVTTLLWLEKQFTDLHTFISKMPVLDPGKIWNWNANLGVFEAAPIETIKSKNVMKNHVLYEATPEHPAQVQTFTQAEPEGTWTTRHMSGAIPQTIKEALMERVGSIQAGIKFAREEANSIQVTDQNIGESLLNWLFAPIEQIGVTA